MTLVFQAYGRTDIVNQTKFSILTLLRWPSSSSAKILIYTDKVEELKNFFAAFPQVDFVEITPSLLSTWRGAIDFVHRVKIEVLKDAAQRTKDNIFYFDGDTVFRQDPIALFQKVDDRNSVMHICEGKISENKDPLSKKYKKFLGKNSIQWRGRELKISITTEMWNAGVIGISRENVSTFAEAIELTDLLYPLFPKHTIEQLAFSFLLQRKTKVHPASLEVLHYWNQKDDYQILIDSFLKNYMNADLALKDLDKVQFPEEPPPKKSFFPEWLKF